MENQLPQFRDLLFDGRAKRRPRFFKRLRASRGRVKRRQLRRFSFQNQPVHGAHKTQSQRHIARLVFGPIEDAPARPASLDIGGGFRE